MIHDDNWYALRAWPVGRATVAEVSGELDLHATTCISPRLDALTSGEQPELVLDLRGVTFIDCGGLSMLLRLRTRAALRGGTLGLVCDSGCVSRLLRLTGLTEAFDVHHDLTTPFLRLSA